MTAFATAWLWWIFATFGIVGLIALWFLAPAAAQLLLQAVAWVFRLLFSYRIGCALLAAIAAGLIVDYKRHAYDDAQAAQRTALFEAAQRQRDERIADQTREAVWAAIANATAANAVVDTDVKGFTDALPPPPPTGNPFLVGADADRLCHIAGKVKCGPSGGQRVPTPRRASGRPADKPKVGLSVFGRGIPWPIKQGQ
jgi:hypothetical protein